MRDRVKREILMVSPFPKQGKYTVDFTALDRYVRTIAEILDKNYRKKIEILSHNNNEKKQYIYKDILITPCWKRGSFFYWVQILIAILGRKTKLIHLQHELYCYGNIINALNFNLLILLLRIIGKNPVTTIHSMVSIKKLDKKFAIENGLNIPLPIIKIGLIVVYGMLARFSKKIIVHNEKLKNILINDYGINKSKIYVIPHPLYSFDKGQIYSKTLKKISNRRYKKILFFGFIANYKGPDVAVKAMKYFDLDRNKVQLILAGNSPKRLREDSEYNDWLKSLKDEARKISSNIVFDHRYIPDNEMKDYFNSSDVIIFPYKDSLSASGPLTFAIRYKKPVLVANVFKDIIKKDLIYGFGSKDLGKSLQQFFTNKEYKDKIIKAEKEQYDKWSDKSVAEKTQRLFKELL